MNSIQSFEVLLPSTNLTADMTFFTERLGFRLDMIFPSDDPAVAVMSGYGLRVRLDRNAAVMGPVLRLLCDDPHALALGESELTSPGGARIHLVEAVQSFKTPKTQHAFVIGRLKDGSPWSVGRAGMRYRDLIPGRLGGAVIASHIAIPDAGPVPDMVHFHDLGFQLIHCYKGWVRLVYEDQGPAFVLSAGDCLIQPPRIRHRVLEASENLQVIEVSVPADHTTTGDHDMTLPTGRHNKDRDFEGQKFCRSEKANAAWAPWRLPGFEARETGVAAATAGAASVRMARPLGEAPETIASHSADILFAFVISGSLTLRDEEGGAHALSEGDAYVIPPAMRTTLADCSGDLELLEVSLPGVFQTHIHTSNRGA